MSVVNPIVVIQPIPISISVYLDKWYSYNSYGSLFLADSKGDYSWRRWLRRDTCEKTIWEKWPSNKPGSRNLFASGCFLNRSATSTILFPSDVFKSHRVYERIQLSIVAGHRPIVEDAGDLWLLRSNVRIDPVIPLRKSRRKRKILSKWIIRQSTWRLYLL